MNSSLIFQLFLFFVSLSFCGEISACAFAASPIAKNIVLMISDGCGYNHVSAARLFAGSGSGGDILERFPYRCGMSTSSAHGSYDPAKAWESFDYVKSGATDSAAAATAMSTGAKTCSGAVGMGIDQRPLLHLLEHAETLGKATGIVTTVPWSHATPAGFIAHNADRENYEQIAIEIINTSKADVIMGCGHPAYGRNGESLIISASHKYVGGRSIWKALKNGTAGGDSDGDNTPDPWTLVEGREEFRSLMSGPTPKRVLGVAKVALTLQQERDGDEYAIPCKAPFVQTVPTLAEMTRAALNVIDNDPDGFVLVVEGGAVDWASHKNQPGRMIEEQSDFFRAVEAVVEYVERFSNWEKTSLIVTSDHECGYLTGPGSGFINNLPIWKPVVDNGAGILPGMEWHSADHTNSLVPVFVKGEAGKLVIRYADQYDTIIGPYIDNAEFARIILEALEPGLKAHPKRRTVSD
ncbi:MAG: alkaline phosphatase [Pseudomonadota bacterium]